MNHLLLVESLKLRTLLLQDLLHLVAGFLQYLSPVVLLQGHPVQNTFLYCLVFILKLQGTDTKNKYSNKKKKYKNKKKTVFTKIGTSALDMLKS